MRTHVAARRRPGPFVVSRHQQRHRLTAVFEDDVREAASTVYAGMPFEDVRRASRSDDIVRGHALEDTVDGAIPPCGFSERNRFLGQSELQRAIPMIADSCARQRTGRPDLVAASI